MTEPKTIDDLRESHRFRTLKTGRIYGKDHAVTMDCIVRDLTNKGARLEFNHVFNGPDRFLLQIGRGDLIQAKVECEVRWRRSNKVGVLFKEEQDLAPKMD